MPILQKLLTVYNLWYGYWFHLDKLTKFGLGLKIETLFIEIIENTFMASYKSGLDKLPYLTKASNSLDLLKFMLQAMWELKLLDNKKYVALSQPLEEMGRMLGGWQRKTRTP